jgi:hypothetical protein
MQWLHFDAHCWGDPSPTPTQPPSQFDQLYDFASTVELVRELYGALARNAGNVPNIRPGDARWEQPTDDMRLGRLLVAPFAIGSSLADESFQFIPFATPGVPGTSVQVNVDVETVFPDGSSTDAGTFTPPI